MSSLGPLIAIYRGDPADGDLMCYVRFWWQWTRFYDSVHADTHPYWADLGGSYVWVKLAGDVLSP